VGTRRAGVYASYSRDKAGFRAGWSIGSRGASGRTSMGSAAAFWAAAG
jgi:hypothetical protein